MGRNKMLLKAQPPPVRLTSLKVTTLYEVKKTVNQFKSLVTFKVILLLSLSELSLRSCSSFNYYAG